MPRLTDFTCQAPDQKEPWRACGRFLGALHLTPGSVGRLKCQRCHTLTFVYAFTADEWESGIVLDERVVQVITTKR